MIYIQSDSNNRFPHHFDAACVMYYAIENLIDYKLVSYEDIMSGKYNNLIKTRFFVGSVEFMKMVFSKIGINDVKLPRNSNRSYIKTTLGAAKKLAESGQKIFIKPFDIKLFTGFVLDNMVHSSISNISEDTTIMQYDVFKSPIKSEWRLYIHNNTIKDSRNYSGDFTISPDYNYAKSIVAKNKFDFPVSYTIDIGVLENGENVVIEYNDMWAIGNYGVDNTIYARMLRDRYFQIVHEIK